MLEFIQGTLLEKEENWAIIEVKGLGFRVMTPLSTHYRLPSVGRECRLLTHLHQGDRSLTLYGFATPQERELFTLLLSIPRMGPKTALAVVSHFSLGDLWEAVEGEDLERIKKVPGIGDKTAKRLLVELKGHLPHESPTPLSPSWEQTLFSALANLGYTRGEIKRAMERAAVTPDMEEEEMIKRCLKALGGQLG